MLWAKPNRIARIYVLANGPTGNTQTGSSAPGAANRCARIRARGFSPLRHPDDHLHAAGRPTKLSPIALRFALPHGTFQMAKCHKAANSPRSNAMAPPPAVGDRPDG